MRSQIYGYLPSRRASLPLDWYQVILLGNRGTCVWNSLPKVVTWKWNDLESNPRPFVLRANTLTITPPDHTHTRSKSGKYSQLSRIKTLSVGNANVLDAGSTETVPAVVKAWRVRDGAKRHLGAHWCPAASSTWTAKVYNCTFAAKLLSHRVCICLFSYLFGTLPSVLWRCWLGGKKGIQPVKNWVVGCWRGYLSGARCRLACGPADATAVCCFSKIQIGFTFLVPAHPVVPEKGPLNACVFWCFALLLICLVIDVVVKVLQTCLTWLYLFMCFKII